MSVRVFEGIKHANLYSQSRPSVPHKVIQIVFEYLKSEIPSEKWETAVDVGCGGGQGTKALAPHFKKVYGFDVSPAQISEAKKTIDFDNVFFEVSPAESLPTVESNSVQLLTAFVAAHWFDLDKFFKESDRILVNKGVVALISCRYPKPIDPSNPNDKRLTDLMNSAYSSPQLSPFNNLKILSTENHYRDIKFPDNYQYFYQDKIEFPFQSVAQNLIIRVKSSSLFQGFLKQDKHSAELFIQEFEQNLKNILKTDNLCEKELTLNYNYFIAMGRKIR